MRAAGIQVSKLAGGSVGDFLVTGSGGTPTWSSFQPSGAINTQQPIIGDGTSANPIALDYNSTYFDLDGSNKLIIADDAISTAKIADDAVTTAKIDDDAVTSAKIDDGTIVDADISATAGIQVSKLAGGSVGDFLVTGSGGTPTWSSFPPSGAINTQQPIIGDGTGANPIALDYNSTYFGIDGSNRIIIADDAISTAKIADDAVTTAKIDDDAVTSAKIDDGTIVDADISATAGIQVSKLAGGSCRRLPSYW